MFDTATVKLSHSYNVEYNYCEANVFASLRHFLLFQTLDSVFLILDGQDQTLHSTKLQIMLGWGFMAYEFKDLNF